MNPPADVCVGAVAVQPGEIADVVDDQGLHARQVGVVVTLRVAHGFTLQRIYHRAYGVAVDLMGHEHALQLRMAVGYGAAQLQILPVADAAGYECRTVALEPLDQLVGPGL